MSPANRRCLWCGENHPTETIRMGEIEVTSCPKLGAHEAVMFAPAHRVTPAEFKALTETPNPPDSNCWRLEYLCELPDPPEPPTPDPVAAVRLEDGSQAVALEPKDLEVRVLDVDDLDLRGLPRWKP